MERPGGGFSRWVRLRPGAVAFLVGGTLLLLLAPPADPGGGGERGATVSGGGSAPLVGPSAPVSTTLAHPDELETGKGADDSRDL
ncbi:MAG TPA: hypothetical protein VIZ68_00235, partial [Thermoplasmata archaeon]